MPLIYKKDYFERFGEKYDHISKRDFDTIRAKQPAVRPRGVLLDLACGSGAMGERFRATVPGLKAIGVDLSRTLLKHANIPVCQADVAHLPFKTGSIDHIVAAAAFHHFPAVGAVVRECARCLKKDGVLAAYDPNLFHPQRFLMMTRPLRLLFYRIGDRAMSPLHFKALLIKNGFNRIRIHYFAFQGLNSGWFGRINFNMLDFIHQRRLSGLAPFISPWYLISAVKSDVDSAPRPKI